MSPVAAPGYLGTLVCFAARALSRRRNESAQTAVTMDNSNQRQLKVLICEDNSVDAEICLHELRRAGFEPVFHRVETEDDLMDALKRETWHIVLSDFRMPKLRAMEALRHLRESEVEIPFIIVTGSIDEETAVSCLKEGADDYVLKDNTARLGPAVQSALQVFHESRRRRELEHELRQSQKLEAVGRLAAGVAHDFNNLLTVIHGYSEDILKVAGKEEVREAARQVLSASERATQLTSRLLGFGRKKPLELTVLDPSALIEEIRGFLSRSLQEGIEFKFKAESTGRVMADAGLLEQVLLNLAINASDAMPSGGSFRISTADLEVGFDEARELAVEPGRYVRILVEDSGEGIAAADLDKVFEPFYTTKGPAQGSGLGLSTAYGILRQCQGTIRVESEVGSGTRFELFLPVTEIEVEGVADPVPPKSVGEGERFTVLVVEDERAVRRLLASILTKHGFEVLESESGNEALEGFGERTDIGLVVCDVAMPGLSGPEFFYRFTKERPGLRFLFVSGCAADTYSELIGLPNASFLPKPFGSEQLMAAIYSTLSDRILR